MKDIKGFEGLYAVTRDGKVWSYPKTSKLGCGLAHHNGIFLKSVIGTTGYPIVGLCKNHKRKPCTVHRLVANAFIPNRESLPQINHKNGIKTDNRVENLEWCTNKENCAHARRTGLNKSFGERQHCAKLTTQDIRKIRETFVKRTAGKLGKKFGVSDNTILRIIHKKTWKHVIS